MKRKEKKRNNKVHLLRRPIKIAKMITKILVRLATWDKSTGSPLCPKTQYWYLNSCDDSSNLHLFCLILLGGQSLSVWLAAMKIKSSFVRLKNRNQFLETQNAVPTLDFQNLCCFSDYELIDLFSSVKNQLKSMVFSKEVIMRNVLSLGSTYF